LREIKKEYRCGLLVIQSGLLTRNPPNATFLNTEFTRLRGQPVTGAIIWAFAALVVLRILLSAFFRTLWRRRKDLFRINDSAELLAKITAERAGKEPDLRGKETPKGEYVPGPDDPLVPAIILGDGFADAQSTVPRPLHHEEAKPLVIPIDSAR